MHELVAGLDLGSTGIKILVTDRDGRTLLVRQRPTPWVGGPAGTTDMLADDLVATVEALLADVADALVHDVGLESPRVASVAVAGMGETGFVIAGDGTVLSPGIAWFDPRGEPQVAALPDGFRARFAGRTGLPWGVQVTLAKLLYLRDSGVPLAGSRWANLPEYLAHVLGGRLVGELSLTSRTGLLDQDTGAPWGEALDLLGVGPGFLPELVEAGTPLGEMAGARVPEMFQGASLTVAGHDHLVSAVSGGLVADAYHVSMGTAEVLLRVVDGPLTADVRRRLAGALVNCVHHVVPGQHVLVAGVKTGLLMRRSLQLFGIDDAARRAELDEQVVRLGAGSALAPGAVDVTGARNDDGVLGLTVRADGVTPAEAFLAVLQHGNDEIRRLVEVMDRELPPATSTLLTGGWAGMESVRTARAAVLPGVRVSSRTQDTAHGAAGFAAHLLAARAAELTD
ncbi:FGGY-family carbohydrate kinase [Oerskovia flava]|uniref:FGGY-family carbohydrate kinase n=1 Tax=Oerskovia flava TaxID=2986422 RepID=UPI002240CB9A|nr:FGGY family carbohydrate kinase [Oerskovia sp. JB1-3-2]